MIHAFRSLLRTPGFLAIAILTLGLGIGMNTAMFSLLNGFLLRPLAFAAPDRLFSLAHTLPQHPNGALSPANFDEVVPSASAIAELAAYRFWAFTVTEPNLPADVPIAMRVTTNYFSVLGLMPELGRAFAPGEATAGNNDVVVISHDYWLTRFGGDTNILNREIRLDGAPVHIIGVLPAKDDTSRLLATIGIYRPLVLSEAERLIRKEESLSVIGRYRPGVTPEQALAQFDAIGRQLAVDHPAENANLIFKIRPLQSTMLTGTSRTITFLLMGLSSFVLLIACANLANLLLARALSRAREFSIRAALGASGAALIKPLALECLILALLGGGAALLISFWTTDWLGVRFGSPEKPADFSADGRVLAFALVASIGTALLFGIAPAWWAARSDLNEALKSGGRSTTGNRSQNRYRQLLIAAQFGFALVLLTGAGFFIRGLDRLIGLKAGWNPDPVVSGVVNLASAKYNTAETIIAFHNEFRSRLLALPGVANAAVSFEVPLFNSPSQRGYRVEGREPPQTADELAAFTNAVSASYFDTIGTRVLRGRAIDETDQLTSRPVVVINESMARALFPKGDAVGQRLGLFGQDDPYWAEIVGVAEDTRTLNITPSSIRFQVYKPFTQEPWQYVTISVRAADPAKAAGLLEPIRRTLASLDPDQPITRLATIPLRIQENTNAWQTINQLLTLFATLGLLLSALGIYGVVTKLVAQRTSEIGIRMALGAQVQDILKLILGNGFRMALIGTAAGLLGGLALGRFLNAEVPTFGGSGVLPISVATAVLLVVALAASYFPARRASRVSPTVALRSE